MIAHGRTVLDSSGLVILNVDVIQLALADPGRPTRLDGLFPAEPSVPFPIAVSAGQSHCIAAYASTVAKHTKHER
jgi:hypothetical protein